MRSFLALAIVSSGILSLSYQNCLASNQEQAAKFDKIENSPSFTPLGVQSSEADQCSTADDLSARAGTLLKSIGKLEEKLRLYNLEVEYSITVIQDQQRQVDADPIAIVYMQLLISGSEVVVAQKNLDTAWEEIANRSFTGTLDEALDRTRVLHDVLMRALDKQSECLEQLQCLLDSLGTSTDEGSATDSLVRSLLNNIKLLTIFQNKILLWQADLERMKEELRIIEEKMRTAVCPGLSDAQTK